MQSLQEHDPAETFALRIGKMTGLSIGVIGIRGLPASYGGIDREAESLYPRLAARGHSITAYCRPRFLDTSNSTYRGVHLCRLPAVPLRSLETLSHVAVSGVHSIVAADYDVIALHAIPPGLLSWIWRPSRVPVVAKIHGLDWKRAKWNGIGAHVLRLSERMLVKRADAIIVVSRSLQQYFLAEYGRDTIYVPNATEPVENHGFKPDVSVLKQFGLEADRYFAFTGRLVPEKRVEDLVRAIESVDSSMKLAIVGDSSYTDPYVSKLKASATDRVVFTGFQSGKALDTLLRCAACHVLPSELEGLPNSLLEAVERGVPSIVSDIDPHREILGPIEGYDLFFPPGDAAALAGRMRCFVDARQHYKTLSERVRNSVRRRYCWDRAATLTEHVFLKVARSQNHRPT